MSALDAIRLTDASHELFLGLAEDAPNWSGSPLYQGGQRENGNLLDLKKKGLIETFEDERRDVFVSFTELGKQYAEELGFDRRCLEY